MYTIEYRMYFSDSVKEIKVVERSVGRAYRTAVYEKIPEIEGSIPYSAWVVCKKYKNGKIKRFNGFEGNPF